MPATRTVFPLSTGRHRVMRQQRRWSFLIRQSGWTSSDSKIQGCGRKEHRYHRLVRWCQMAESQLKSLTQFHGCFMYHPDTSWQIPICQSVFAHAADEVPPPEVWRLSELPGQEWFSLCLFGKDAVGRPQGAGMIQKRLLKRNSDEKNDEHVSKCSKMSLSHN